MTLHSLILLGTSSKSDGWIATDSCKLAWAVSEATGQQVFLSPRPLVEYDGASDEGCLLGSHTSTQILIPFPENPRIFPSPQKLKTQFITSLSTIAQNAAPEDTIFVAFASHRGQHDGGILVGDIDDPQVFITPHDVHNALQKKHKSVRVFIWLTSCFSGHWVTCGDWEAFAAARECEESQLIHTSPSGQYRGNTHTISSFNTIYPRSEASNAGSDHSTDIESPRPMVDLVNNITEVTESHPDPFGQQHACSSASRRPLPFPVFTPRNLERLELIPPGSSSSSSVTSSVSYPSVTASVTPNKLQGFTVDLEHLTLQPEMRDRLVSLSASKIPSTASGNRLHTWMRRFGTLEADPNVGIVDILHTLGSVQHLMFLAAAPFTARLWDRSEQNVDTALDDLHDMFSQQTGISNINLFALLEVNHRYKSWTFTWITLVLPKFYSAWKDTGYPKFSVERFQEARDAVTVKLLHLGSEEPHLLCPCGQHLLLAEEDYELIMLRWRIERIKEELIDGSGHLAKLLLSMGDTATLRSQPSQMVSSQTFP
ncbi:hypothetical protein C8J56DRAFT_933955 [Mycena floridula]|nr:hypothetical protein C8J56DRAFT_933955 [Mycena floridula]